MTSCVVCSEVALQSLGASDTGEYLWFCPSCESRFETKRAARFFL